MSTRLRASQALSDTTAATGEDPRPGTDRSLIECAATRGQDVLVTVAFVAVPLVCSPLFWDQFTTVKWYLLHLVAVAGAGLLALQPSPWPRFVRDHRGLVAALAVLAVAAAFRTGAARAVSPLLDRLALVTITVILYAHLSRHSGDLRWIALPTVISLIATDVYLLAQVFGHQPFPWLTAGDFRSAFFGNVNIAAQYLALGLPFLFWSRRRWPGMAAAMPLEAAIAATLACLYLLGGRSALAAAGCTVLLWLIRQALAPRVLARTLAGAALLAWMAAAPPPPPPPSEAVTASTPLDKKAFTTWIRVQLWGGTLQMALDHPLGVGAAGFPDRFVPYQVGRLPPDEALLHRWPHNEYLRVLVEEGWPTFALISLLLVRLGRDTLHGGRRAASPDRCLVASLAIVLGVESMFQFPLAMASAALMGAFVLAWSLWAHEAPAAGADLAGRRQDATESRASGSRAEWARRVTWAAGAVLMGAALWRVARSEYLFVQGRRDRAALEEACRLDPRRVEACVSAAWQEIQAGDHEAAQRMLLRLLENSPYYYPAIKLAGQDAWARGRREEGCLYLWIYDGLFQERSSVHGSVATHCSPALLGSFAGRVRMPRYERLPAPPAD